MVITEYNWETCPLDIRACVYHLLSGIKKELGGNIKGFYLHGSLAMGGFNPKTSDIDILAVTCTPLTEQNKRRLAECLLHYSANPYPFEISFLNESQLQNWSHPSPFDFHYGESWRDRYAAELAEGKADFSEGFPGTDADLAAHAMMTYHRGICLTGKPVRDIIPEIPVEHYIASIMADFEDCKSYIYEKPVYCVLNLIRVFWYLKEGQISSKQEAAGWGRIHLPETYKQTIEKAGRSYESSPENIVFAQDELTAFKDYIADEVNRLLNRPAY